MSKQKYTFHGTAESQSDEYNATDVKIMLEHAFDRNVKLLSAGVEMAVYAEPVMRWRALAHDVLVVAVPGAIGDWAAYVGAVPGKNHEKEKQHVADQGVKLAKELAMLLFPVFDPDKYRE